MKQQKLLQHHCMLQMLQRHCMLLQHHLHQTYQAQKPTKTPAKKGQRHLEEV